MVIAAEVAVDGRGSGGVCVGAQIGTAYLRCPESNVIAPAGSRRDDRPAITGHYWAKASLTVRCAKLYLMPDARVLHPSR